MLCHGRKFNLACKKMKLTLSSKGIKKCGRSLERGGLCLLCFFIILTAFDTIYSEVDNKYLLK